MKKKETVIVFDGEDSFINHRNVIYDKRKGKSTFVGQDGSVSATPPETKSQEPKPDDKPVGPTKTIDDGSGTGPKDGGPSNPPPKDTGIGYNRGNFLMPDPNDPAFCDKIQMFILTNGNGTATAEEIMSAHRAFQNYCAKKPDPSDTGGGTGTGTGDSPTPSDPRPPRKPVKDYKAPSTEVYTTTVVAPLIPETLGLPIAPQSTGGRGGVASGGGGGDQKKEEKKKSYWWVLILLAAAGGMYYYSRRKN